ncbi:MAG: DsrH/TusB family sulfur metabolism protein [Candidatus Jordarchaeaceae archaeon]
MLKIVFIILEPPSSDRAIKAFSMIREMIKRDADVSIYLLGDGVYCGMKGVNLEIINSDNLRVFVNKEDIEARGILDDLLLEKVQCQNNSIERMIVDVMENADRILCF